MKDCRDCWDREWRTVAVLNVGDFRGWRGRGVVVVLGVDGWGSMFVTGSGYSWNETNTLAGVRSVNVWPGREASTALTYTTESQSALRYYAFLLQIRVPRLSFRILGLAAVYLSYASHTQPPRKDRNFQRTL